MSADEKMGEVISLDEYRHMREMAEIEELREEVGKKIEEMKRQEEEEGKTGAYYPPDYFRGFAAPILPSDGSGAYTLTDDEAVSSLRDFPVPDAGAGFSFEMGRRLRFLIESIVIPSGSDDG